MSAAHTPGPWFVEAEGAGVYVMTADMMVASPAPMDKHPTDSDEYIDGPETEANARLIAAAPDLLTVAEFFLRGIEGGHIRCAPYIDFDPNAETLEIKSPAARLREAIAKATGGAL